MPLKKSIMEDLKCVLLFGAILLILHFTGIGCIIRYLTGISCAGCGMSRALFCLLQGHMAEAVSWHPLILAMPPAALLWFCRRKLPRKLVNLSLGTFAAAFVIVYLIRLVQGSPVVGVHLHDGMLARAAKEVFYVLH